MATKFRHILLFAILLFSLKTCIAKPQPHNLSIDESFNNLTFETKISPDGRWFALKKKNNKLLVINTNTKHQIEIDNITDFYFIKNMIIGTNTVFENKIIIYNLNNNSLEEISNVRKHSIIKNKILYNTLNSNSLVLLSLESMKKQVIKRNVIDYIINELSNISIIVVQNRKNSLFEIHTFNLKTGETYFIKHTSSPIREVTWSDNATHVAIHTMDKIPFILDLQNNNVQQLPSVVHSDSIGQFDYYFFPNNKLYGNFSIKNKRQQTKDELVEIWNGNDNNLNLKFKQKASTGHGMNYEFIFDLSTSKFTISPLKNTSLLTTNINIQLQYDNQPYNDYTHFLPPADLYLKSTNKETVTLIEKEVKHNLNISCSPSGKHLQYLHKGSLNIVDVESGEKKTIKEILNINYVLWDKHSTRLYFLTDRSFGYLSIKSGNIRKIICFEENTNLSIVNTLENHTRSIDKTIYPLEVIDGSNPILIKARTLGNQNESIYLINNDKFQKVVDDVPFSHSKFKWSDDYTKITYTRQNYTQPPMVILWQKKKEQILFKPNISEEIYKWRKQKIISYTNKLHQKMHGILLYPKDFNPQKKYPMITNIYQGQFYLKNIFFIPKLTPAQQGSPILNELGYFVFLPDTQISDAGPGLSALDCVKTAIETALTIESSIDKDKLGLMGYSFGGYETNFIITQTNMFKAAVSGGAINDIVLDYYNYNYSYNRQNYYRYESAQFDMRSSFGDNPDKYLKNNPILYAHQVQTPLLSYTGGEDEHSPWIQTRYFYGALKRYNVPQITLYYKNTEHALGKKQLHDVFSRIINWFDYYLKDDKNIEWIQKGVK